MLGGGTPQGGFVFVDCMETFLGGQAGVVEIDRRSWPIGAGKGRLDGKKKKNAVVVIGITKCFRAISS